MVYNVINKPLVRERKKERDCGERERERYEMQFNSYVRKLSKESENELRIDFELYENFLQYRNK